MEDKESMSGKLMHYAGRVILSIPLDEYKTDMEEAFLAGRSGGDSFEMFYKTWGESGHA